MIEVFGRHCWDDSDSCCTIALGPPMLALEPTNNCTIRQAVLLRSLAHLTRCLILILCRHHHCHRRRCRIHARSWSTHPLRASLLAYSRCHAMASAVSLRKWQLLLTQLQLLQAKLSAGQACDAADVRALQYAAGDVPCFDSLPVAQRKAAVQEHKVQHIGRVWATAVGLQKHAAPCQFPSGACSHTLQAKYSSSATAVGQTAPSQ